MTSDKTVVVITPLLATFRAKGCSWVEHRNQNGTLGVTLKREEPGRGTPAVAVAEFPEVHAVFYEDDVELVELGDILEDE
jgi:hypothetical protein